jgi:serine/threonine protein kinase
MHADDGSRDGDPRWRPRGARSDAFHRSRSPRHQTGQRHSPPRDRRRDARRLRSQRGRTVRKRCGNPTYSAPEVWNDDREPESAFAADVYSAACLAFELLTKKPLFESEDFFGVIRQHMLHDGWPPRLAELRGRPELRKIAESLSRALQPMPARRTRVRMLRTELARAAEQIRHFHWPLHTKEVFESDPYPSLDGSDDDERVATG